MDHKNLEKWQKMTDAVVTDFTGGGSYLDKPAMCIDNPRIGIAYTEGKQSAGAIISFVLSPDQGNTWKKPVPLSDMSTKMRTGSSVTMSGNRIVVSWMEGRGNNLNEAWYTISDDGGQSFSAPKMIYRLNEPLRPPKGYALGVGPSDFIPNNTWLTCIRDERGAPTFYLSCAEGTGQGSEVLLFKLSPNAKEWAQPMRAGNSIDGSLKFFPSLAASWKRPALLYYYRANADTALTDVYLSIVSEDSRFESVKINTVSSDWSGVSGDKQRAPVQRNFGDYITLAADHNLLVATWTDGRTGVARVYARTIELNP